MSRPHETLGRFEGEGVFFEDFFITLDGGSLLTRAFVEMSERHVYFGAPFPQADRFQNDDRLFVLSMGHVTLGEPIFDFHFGHAIGQRGETGIGRNGRRGWRSMTATSTTSTASVSTSGRRVVVIVTVITVSIIAMVMMCAVAMMGVVARIFGGREVTLSFHMKISLRLRVLGTVLGMFIMKRRHPSFRPVIGRGGRWRSGWGSEQGRRRRVRSGHGSGGGGSRLALSDFQLKSDFESHVERLFENLFGTFVLGVGDESIGVVNHRLILL